MFHTLRSSALLSLAKTKASESPIEALMLAILGNSKRFIIVMDDDVPDGAGYFVYPQKEIGPYRADFFIQAIGWGREAHVWPPTIIKNIVLECDGHDYHSSPEQKARDSKRDDYMRNKGYDILRFTGTEIVQGKDYLARDISRHINNLMVS